MYQGKLHDDIMMCQSKNGTSCPYSHITPCDIKMYVYKTKVATYV